MKRTIKESTLRTLIRKELKKQLNEDKGDPMVLADIFARFLIGNRENAIRQLQGQMKNDFGTMEAVGTKEYNDQFNKLVTLLAKAIKSAM